MADFCVNTMTVYAKSKTIDRFRKECFDEPDSDPFDPDFTEPEFSVFKVFEMTSDEFHKLRHEDRDFCDGNGCVWRTEITPMRAAVHPPDPKIDPENPFISFEFRFMADFSPPIKAVKQIAKRYQCAVTLHYSDYKNWGGIACHYDKETDGVHIDYRYFDPDLPDYEAMNLPG
jgi:hypothetical protein